MKEKRNYGIDLLRNILMLFIIIGHLFVHTKIRNQLTFFSDKWFYTWALQTLTICSVDCFIIITGYYMIDNIYSLWKGILLWIKVLLYSVIIFLIMLFAGQVSFSSGVLLDALFPIFRKEYWFFTMYFLLYLLIPFINEAIRNMTKDKLKYLVAMVVSIFYIEPIFSALFYQYDQTEGFSIIAFITLYVIGAFLSKQQDLKIKYCVVLLVSSSLVILLSKVVLESIKLSGKMNLGTGLFYHYNTIFVLVNAIVLFLIFKQVNIKPFFYRLIKWCSPSVFAVYLLHENPIVRNKLWNPELSMYLSECNFSTYIIMSIGIPVVIFFVSIIVDRFVINKILEFFIKTSFANKLKEKCSRYSMVVR